VFADALVPRGPSFPKAGANRARRATFSQSRKIIDPIGHGASRALHCLGNDGGPNAVAGGGFKPERVEGIAPQPLATMVIALPNGRVNRIPRTAKSPVKQAFPPFADPRAGQAFTPDSSRCLNCPSNLIGHDHPNKPANGKRMIRQSADRAPGR
jgi:hypothetical protein